MSFSRCICFLGDDNTTYFADIDELPAKGTSIKAYSSFEGLIKGGPSPEVKFSKLLPPLPRHDLPIYCVGLNYKTHANEAKLSIPTSPPVWTKPFASLASPGEDIHMSKYCASSLPDFEGELVFVTSKECKDISPEEAEEYILGYTIGNDLSCRFYQMQNTNGGQFFYAKAFDKFAPIGPVLVSPDAFKTTDARLVTRVNGRIMQDADVGGDMVYTPAKILSFMSQSTTIPAYTAIMTGTPAGVGAFRVPQQFLNDGDVVEIEISNIGILKNKILFPDGKQMNL